jgi:lysozyme
MIPRRTLLGGLAALTVPTLAGCGGKPPTGSGFASPPPPPPPQAVGGLDAVIDISHNVTVSDFDAIRRSSILAVIHKCSEGGDWFDPSYGPRRRQAEAAGLLWGAYHFGTGQYSGADQAAAFLSAAQPGPSTLMALDVEPNERKPRNTMRLAQAEAFVQAVYRATGRLPLIYTHPKWANGETMSRRGLSLGGAITPQSMLGRCDLWLADYREIPEVPYAWQDRGWRLWQYVANEDDSHAAYGTTPRAIAGVSHCDRNLFSGDAAELYRYWKGGAGRV